MSPAPALTVASSNTKVATVAYSSQSGVVTVTPVGNGTANITVTAAGTTVQAVCAVTVDIKVASIGIDSKTGATEVVAGKTLQMAATVLPNEAKNKAVKWSVDNTSAATINATTGLLTAKTGLASKTGVVVTATAADGGGAIGTKSIDVIPAPKSIEGMTAKETIVSLSPYMFTPTVSPADSYQDMTVVSSNTKVATVAIDPATKEVTVTPVANGTANITVTAAGYTAVKKVCAVTVDIKAVTINVTSKTTPAEVAASKTLQMVATVSPPDTKNKAVTWSVDDTSIATINATTGLLTVKATAPLNGATKEITVTATAKDGSEITGAMTVYAKPMPISIEGVTANETIDSFKYLEFTPSVKEADAPQAMTVASSNTKVATVTINPTTKKVTVTPVANGTAKITVTASGFANVKADCVVTVGIKSTSVRVTSKTGALDVSAGKTLQMVANILPAEAKDKTVKWNVDDSIATIDKNGLLKVNADLPSRTPLTVTATANDSTGGESFITGDFTITAYPAPDKVDLGSYTSHTFDNKTPLELGDYVSVIPGDASQDVTYATSNAKVAKVDKDGIVTPVANGNANITVTAAGFPNVKAVCAVTVDFKVANITVTSKTGKTEVAAGKTLQMVATVSPSNAKDKTVTWSVDDESVATINEKSGLLTANANLQSKTPINVCAAPKDGGMSGVLSIDVLPITTEVLAGVPHTFDAIGETYNLFGQLTVTPSGASLNMTYTSSNAKVVTVDKYGLVTAVGNGTASITVKATDGSNKSAVVKMTVDVQATKVEIRSKLGAVAPANVAAGKSIDLVAVITPATAKAAPVWSIDELSKAFAKIDSKTGKLTVGSGATGQIEVKMTVPSTVGESGYLTCTKLIEVTPLVTKVWFDYSALAPNLTENSAKNTVSMNINGGASLTPADFPIAKTTPDNGQIPNNGQVVYTSSNVKVATVHPVTGAIEAIGKGVTTIKAAATDGSAKSASYTLTVVSKVTSIKIEPKPAFVSRAPDTYILIAGKTMTMTAAVNKKSGEVAPTNAAVTWAIVNRNDNGAVTINSKTGVISFVKNKPFSSEEFVLIQATAADGSFVPINTVTVILYPATTKLEMFTEKNLTAKTITLGIGDTEQLWTRITSTNGLDKYDTYGGLLYISSKPSVATVDASTGEVTAVAKGTTTIKAAAQDGSGKTVSCTVKVVDAGAVPTIKLSSPDIINNVMAKECGKLNVDQIPRLSWNLGGSPVTPGAYAVFMVDSTSPGNGFVHLAATNITTTPMLHYNDFGDIGYGGPQPPSGTHTYYIYIFALKNSVAATQPRYFSASTYTSSLNLFKAYLGYENIICSDVIKATYKKQ